jgi:hypothetical protein
MTLARDLGNGPHRPFGSALRGDNAGLVERFPRIGRTIKPQSAGPCGVCGERRWFCECEDDLGDCPSGTAPLSKPEPASRLGPDGRVSHIAVKRG